jgi:ABC-type Fe3+-siderophore transport system permease subunit
VETLAIAVTIIVFGLLFIGLVGPLLAILFRRNKINKYWVISYLVLLALLTVLAWQGSERLAAISLVSAMATTGIAFWPKANK